MSDNRVSSLAKVAFDDDHHRARFPSFLAFLVNEMIGPNSSPGNKCAFLDT